MFTPRCLLTICSASLLVTFSGGAQENQEWTRFRGPNGSGLSTLARMPSTWTEKDYRWKYSLPGGGHASPVIIDGKVFVLCGDKQSARRTIVCLSTTDGSLLWKRDFESSNYPKNRDNSYATSTPTVDPQRVYLYWTTLERVTVLALDHSGNEIWERGLGPYKSQHGSGASLIVYEDLVIVNNDQEGPSSLLALDAKTGKTRWEKPRRRDRAAYSTPCVRPLEGSATELIFTSSGNGVTAVDPGTGNTRWELTNAFPFRVVGSPVLADGLIVGACGEGGVGRRLVAVRPPTDGHGPELAYQMKNSIPYVPTPIAVSGLLFLWCDNGLVVCVRAADGERVWQHKISDSFYSSPVCAGGLLYGVSKRGVVYVLNAGDRDELVGTIPLGEPSFATPAIAEGAMFFRTEASLYCLPCGNGLSK